MGCAASAQKVLAVAPVSTSTEDYFAYEGAGPWYTCKPEGLILPRLANSGAASARDCPPQTLQDLLKKAAEEKGDRPALKAEKPCPALQDSGPPPALPEAEWATWTYRQYYEDARKAAKAFVKLGFEQFDTVAIWGFNAPEWMLSALAAGFAGGKVGGLYPTDTPQTAAFKVVHSGASIVVLEDQAKLARLLPALAARQDPRPCKVRAFVAYGYEPAPGESVQIPGSNLQVPVLSWSAMMAAGSSEDDAIIDVRSKAVQPGHCAVLVYTSGTTGEPKAVMLSHDAMIFEAVAFVNITRSHVGLCGSAQQERILSYLPLSHVAGKMVDVCFPFVATASSPAWVTAYFARPYDLKAGGLKDRLNVARPTVFLGVPLVWEKIADRPATQLFILP